MENVNKLFLILLIILSDISFAQNEKNNSFEVYIYNTTDDLTNIRNTPNGTIIFKINSDYFSGTTLNVIDFKGGWLKINQINGIDELTTSNFEGWVHNSVIGIGTTHDIYLLDEPNGKKLYKIKGEQGDTFRIIDLKYEWVKIKTKKGNGWVKSIKLCGNPVTTCP